CVSRPRSRNNFFFQAEDGIRDFHVTGVQTCALPISSSSIGPSAFHLLVNANGDLTDERGTTAGAWDRSWTSNATYRRVRTSAGRSEEHTSELQSRENLVCRLLLVKKKCARKSRNE